jgi:hypothetical protein
MTTAIGAKAVEGLRRGITHWRQEIRDTRDQIAGGKHPQHDGNCRRYIAECKGHIRKLEGEIHGLREGNQR